MMSYTVPQGQNSVNERRSKVRLNSLAPGKFELKFYISNFQMDFSDWWLRHLLWNCPNMNVTGLHWWSVNIGWGNGWVPSGNKPLPEPMLTQAFTRPQWVKLTNLPYIIVDLLSVELKKYDFYNQIWKSFWENALNNVIYLKWSCLFRPQWVNSSPPEQKGCHFADDIFGCIFVNEKFCILVKFHWSLLLRVQLTITQHWFR